MNKAERNKLIEELDNLYTDLFVFKSKAPFQWIEEDIREIMIKISAVIESLVEVEKRRKRREDGHEYRKNL